MLDRIDASLDDESYEILSRADGLFLGIERGTGDEIVIVAEATWRVSLNGVSRAFAWARQLSELGVQARGAIVSIEPPRQDILSAAESSSIWVIAKKTSKEAA